MSQTPNKALQKMCKSPKNTNFHIKQEKIEYENMSTNCTVVGSNNLNLVKKPQLLTNMSPAYSMPSPNYPQSPYSSPASLKSPSPSLKPPTPQPNFPVMQIIHNNLISRPMQTSQPQNIIKLKPHLNILPKPSASPQPSPKPSVSPQIVIPTANQPTAAATATLMPTAQPLLLNQMQMLTAPGVQFILRPHTATPMATAGPKLQYSSQATSQAPQGLILQPACAPQQLLHLSGPARSQPMVRVLPNGVQLAPSTTTYVTTQMANQPINATHIQQTIVNNAHQQQHQQQHHQHIQIQQHVLKKKPKVKVKKKLDLANLMKLSGIGDEDDIQFESDTSQSESEHTSVPTTPQPQQPVTPTGSVSGQQITYAQPDSKKNIHNIQISSMPQPNINTGTPVVQLLNQNFQSGMISNSSSQAAAAHASGGLPFNSTFITPNFTINNGLMLQRSGGFKLTFGDDGQLVLQHDPALNQELQNQLILQSLLGLNGSLVLQPSMDQQTVQQTVQTIQQQSVQTIQQQTVQSQTIQTVQQQTVQPQVQHTIQSLQPQIQQQTVQQTIQHQTVNALQQPMQIVQPQPIHSLHSQVPTVHSISQSQVHNLQSQIQSLLQQQNVAVQAQAVHQNVPQNVHSQAMQNLAQNVQNMTSQNMAAQGSVQNVVAQNMSQSAAASVVAQNIAQTAAVQNMTQGVQNMPPASTHSVQGFQQAHTQTTQPILKVQPFLKSQPPVQTVQPIQHHSHQQQDNHPNPPSNSTSYVVNLTPEQLEQLKRNGQVTVNGQTIFMQRPNKDPGEKKLSPKMKSVKKVSEINKIQGIKSLLQEGVQASDNLGDRKQTAGSIDQLKGSSPQHMKPVSSPVSSQPTKHILPQNHVQPLQNKPQQPQAMVQPSVQHAVKMERQKSPLPSPKQQKVSPTIHMMQDSNGTNAGHEVDKLLGQILEDSGSTHAANGGGNNHGVERQPQQRITTIQLTPQKQQQLKTIQMQIQTLSARLQPGDTEVHNALKGLFAEQQKILASGKLLPPDKVYYLNNQLTIVNPSSLNLPSPASSVKSEPPSPGLSTNHGIPARSSSTETLPTTTQSIGSGTQSHASPRVSVSVSTSTGDLPAHSTIHHHPPAPHHHHPSAQPGGQPPHVAVNHPNHVLSQRLSAISQVSQLPPLYPKQAQLHSPQLHSPQVNSPQLPSPQPPQLHGVPGQGAPNQPHAAALQLHLQQTQINTQVVKPKQPSPIPQQQAKSQHALNQQLFQQQQQQQHFQHQHLLNQQAQKQQAAQSANQQQLSLARKAHLIESQLVVDQQGATNPNVHQPFRDKRDACVRLIRYHCLDQPVLSEQDLHKADENFELNAQHYITKFDRMIDKYKYLLMKESMRQVQTSELMMLDRMFLADEQQSLMKLRQDYEAEFLSLVAEPAQSAVAQDRESTGQQHSQLNEAESCSEEYDEWACIQRELGCLPDLNHHQQHPANNHHHTIGQQPSNQCSAQNQYNNLKRTSSSDSRLETLKRFRVDKHTKRHEPLVNSSGVQCVGSLVGKGSPLIHGQSKCGYESNSSQANSSYSSYKEEESENNSIDEQVQSAINSILNLQQTQLQQQNSLDLDSILS